MIYSLMVTREEKKRAAGGMQNEQSKLVQIR